MSTNNRRQPYGGSTRQPYGGAIGMKSSASMDFHTNNRRSAATAAATAAAGLPRSASAMSLSSAAAAAALKRSNSQQQPPALVASRRAANRPERRSSMTERVLRPSSVTPQRSQQSSGLASLRANSIRSTLSFPKSMRSISGRASSIRSFDSDLNSISEDRAIDTIAPPKLIPPLIEEEDAAVRREPPSRSLSPSKSALKDSRSSSVLSGSDTDEASHSGKKKHVRISFSSAEPPPVMPSLLAVDKPAETVSAGDAADPDADGAVKGADLVEGVAVGDYAEIYEDAPDHIDASQESFPNILTVVDSDGSAPEPDQTAQNAVAPPNPPVQTKARSNSSVSRKVVGSGPLKPPSRSTTPPPMQDELESRARSQTPTLLHPMPRSAKPLNGILKSSSPDPTAAPKRAVAPTTPVKHKSLPGSFARSGSPPPPVPSLDTSTELNTIRNGLHSSSSFRRNGEKPATNGVVGMKTSLRGSEPTNGMTSLRGEYVGFHSQPRHAQRPQSAQARPRRESTGPVTGVAPPPIVRSNSASSFRRETVDDGEAFGFKRFSSAVTPVRKSRASVDAGSVPRGRAVIPHSQTTNGVSSMASRLNDSDSDDGGEPFAARSGRGNFPPSHPFSYEPEAVQQHQHHDVPEEPVVGSYEEPLRPPPAMASLQPQSASAPTTPAKPKKMSQYQLFKMEKQQRKAALGGGLKTVRESQPPPAAAPAVPYSTEYLVPGRQKKKKFGGLRKLFGLD